MDGSEFSAGESTVFGDMVVDEELMANSHMEEEIEEEEHDLYLKLILVLLLACTHYYSTYFDKRVEHLGALRSGYQHVQDLLHGHERRLKRAVRMSGATFMRLCSELEPHLRGMNPRNRLSVEESVAMYLAIVGRHFTLVGAADEFEHSLETVSR